MLGKKINEFDLTDGSIEVFNQIFPNTVIEENGYVEILGISDSYNIESSNAFIRDLDINGKIIKFNFGISNFLNNEDFIEADNVRFKYFAKDLDGNIIEKAYNCKSLAEKIGCSVSVIKSRLVKKIDKKTRTKNRFNVKRVEI